MKINRVESRKTKNKKMKKNLRESRRKEKKNRVRKIRDMKEKETKMRTKQQGGGNIMKKKRVDIHFSRI